MILKIIFKKAIFGILLVLWLTGSSLIAQAETGIVFGKVTDVLSGEVIAGVFVTIHGTKHQTETDDNGRFHLSPVSAGNHNLVIVRRGYISVEIPVLVTNGKRIIEQIELVPDQQEEERVLTQVYRKAEPGAHSRHWQVPNSGSNITSQQTDQFADYTINDALARISGVQVDRRGVINIRGAGADRYNVTMDGQRLGTTGAGERSFDLGSISADLVRDVEVIKILTPDMDADALAGSINLRTIIEPDGQRQLNIRLGGGTNASYFPYMDPNSRASLNYSEALRDDFTLAVNLTHMSDRRAWETLEVDYDVADFGTGYMDVIERVAPGLQIDSRNRTGGSIQLIFQPSIHVTYHVRGVLNISKRDRIGHTESSSVNGDWLRIDTTGAAGRQGNRNYNFRLQNNDIHQYILQAGARHIFNEFNLEYKVGWTQSSNDRDHMLLPFKTDGLDFTINMADRARPFLKPTNIDLIHDGSISRDLFRMQNIDRIVDEYIDNTYSARIDAEIPLGLVALRLGSSAKWTNKVGNFGHSNYRYNPTFLDKFTISGLNGIKVFNEDSYQIPKLIDASFAQSFIKNNFLMLRFDKEFFHDNSEHLNYSAKEHIYAGYSMASIDWGSFVLSGGARLEYSDLQYDGRRIEYNFIGRFIRSVDTTRTIAKFHVFPNSRLIYSPLDNIKIGLSYSKSLARPDYRHLAPFEKTNIQDTTIYRGNPMLNPVISDNFDLIFEHYLGNSGFLSAGFFYKHLAGFVYEHHGILDIREDEVIGLNYLFQNNENLTVLPVYERTYKNSDETASIYGVEINWQQYLDFLPGILGNFGIYLNYTWSQSIFDVDYRDDEVQLPGQSPHIVNAAVDYVQGRFSSQISWHWTAASLIDLRSNPMLAPSIDPINSVYLDQYQDGWTDLSASFRIRLFNNFRLWVNINNILDIDRIQYVYSRDKYPVEIDRRGGLDFNMGIIFNL